MGITSGLCRSTCTRRESMLEVRLAMEAQRAVQRPLYEESDMVELLKESTMINPVEQLPRQLTACGPVDCSALVPPPMLPPRARWVSASPARVAWPCPNVCCVRRVSRCLSWYAPRPCQRQRRRPASRRDLQPMWVAAAAHMWHALLWHVVSDWRSC